YISPSTANDSGITAIDPTVTEAPSPDPKLIIPKLNVNVPIAFGISNDETTVMNAMNHGVAQFAIPGANALPGQVGNLVITGHSAGDIYSNNQYKFIFSGLERLVENDLIYVNHNSIRYTYAITRKETVEPSNVAALVYPTTKPVLTLITCTPLGTSRYRLLVTAEQINPVPSQASTPTTPTPTESQAVLPANEKSFLEKIWQWLTGQN
ncbi:MAG: sortase, partial [Candidatus Saccharibacteria bacterium]|nr:sortase [Candidatus Saccharibacteria bacterium]